MGEGDTAVNIQRTAQLRDYCHLDTLAMVAIHRALKRIWVHNQLTHAPSGTDMKLRTAKSGTNKGNQFWGCGNYPRCRSILPFEAAS